MGINTQQNLTQQKNKLLGLELIRFICALAVLIWHYQHFFYDSTTAVNFTRELQPYYSKLSLFYNHGYFGVQIFWCISGFIFFWKYKETIADRLIDGRKFFLLRFSRLYPLHIVTLLMVAAFQCFYFLYKSYYFVYQQEDSYHFLLQVFFASNWGLEKGDSFNGPIWSISVEVLTYCIFFILLRYFGRSFFINLSVLALCVLVKYLKDSMPIFDCLAFFYAGGLSAIALQYFQNKKTYSIVYWIALGLTIALICMFFIVDIFQQSYLTRIYLLALMPTLLFVSAKEIHVKVNLQNMVIAAGNMTYASYLIHFPIQIIIVLYFLWAKQTIPYYSPLFFLSFMGVTLLASYLIFRFFELPVQNYLRKRFS